MHDARELILQDVRCFQGEQRGRLRPITLLVGENSTGKTTFLGCYRVFHQMFSMRGVSESPDFNEEPFAMGSFRDVVRSRRGPSDRIDELKIGLRVGRSPDDVMSPYELSFTFGERGLEPVISSLRFQFAPDAFLEMRSDEDGTVFQIPDCTRKINGLSLVLGIFWLFDTSSWSRISGEFSNLEPIVDYLRCLSSRRGDTTRSCQRAIRWPGEVWLQNLPELIPIAPLRSKPKRTYDPIRGFDSPEGEHVPMLMMQIDRTNTRRWKSLHDGLVKFGREAGLFSDIKVERYGRQMSGPFQLQVKVRSGSHANLMDVGYGVSQSLPILVDVLERSARRGGRGCSFLLQQPEVHLHPRGQAELASLFVQAFRQSGNRFLVETHSDYIIDRVRISVRKGLLKPDDVSVLYFEPKGSAVSIHNLTLDDDGNLLDAPKGYRDFFTKETDELLGFAG